MSEAGRKPARLDRSGYELVMEDGFARPALDDRLWIPHYLPQWSSREASAARYRLAQHRLHLLIEDDQPPWCPEWDGWLRVSSLQTGLFAGPLGSSIGQHRFHPDVVVREEQPTRALFTPQYGLFELRAHALADPHNMVALWMIGFEDEPERSAEICIFEIFGRDVRPDRVVVGAGIRPFGDPSLVDDFSRQVLIMDAREAHDYSVEWTPGRVAYYVDDELIKVSRQSPTYPMQFMLNIYEFADGPNVPSPAQAYPKEFVVERFRACARPDTNL